MANPLKFELVQQEPGQSQSVLVPFFKTEKIETAWISNGVVPGFTGARKEVFQAYHPDRRQQVFLLGLGEQKMQAIAFRSLLHFIKNNQAKLGTELLVDLRHLPEALVYQCVLGLGLSNYSVGAFKTSDRDSFPLRTVQVWVKKNDGNSERQLFEAQQAAQVMKKVCALVDAPANVKTPQYLAQWVLDSASQHGYRVDILDHQALAQEGLHALLAVGRGSENRPVLIKASYTHPDLDPKQVDLGLVGKGVTFDTGGISLKKPLNMHYMKCDMAGAAAVMGAMELIARLQLPLNVVAIIPAAENSVDAQSIRPGDVISSFSGKSIEVIDTDAEGRLILADALSYIQQHFQPGVLIDLATLTGSCVAALGYEVAGLFSQNQELAKTLYEVGELSGEKVWQLPMWDSYGEFMESDIADIKNLSGKPVAGAITAAKFLEYFVEDHRRWAHLDVAGTTFGDTEFAKMKSATGYGVRLLVDFAKTLITTKTQ